MQSRTKIIIFFLVFALAGALLGIYSATKEEKVEPQNCAAAVLTAEQDAYVRYKKAVSAWSYENGVELNYEEIDALYYGR